MDLTAENVSKTFMDCLHEEHEIAGMDRATVMANSIIVEGITTKVGFNPKKIEKRKNDIKSMLSQLPDQFMQEKGGGYTFLAACEDKDGKQWSGLHQTMEQLFMLGQAIECVRYCLPRDLWSMFPGGVPYYAVSFEGFQTKT